MNFKLLDEYGRQVEMSRNLALLRQHFGTQARASFKMSRDRRWRSRRQRHLWPTVRYPIWSPAADGARAIVTWDFEPLPELMSLQKANRLCLVIRLLRDMGEHCELTVWDDELQARAVHTRGLLRLARLRSRII